MGVIPVAIQVTAFLLAGYFIGKSHRRSFSKNLLLTAGLALVFSMGIIIWTRTGIWTGIRFLLLNVVHLTLFGGIGVGIGYLKSRRDAEREEVDSL